MNDRYLASALRDDAFQSGKMAFVSGPRQVGKTTLGKSVLRTHRNYFSWDEIAFRRAWLASPRDALSGKGPGPIVLDELHKDRRWKNHLKGYYDTVGAGDGILVTGSARLDLYRRGGDSMLGRYLPYRLHPWTVGERKVTPTPDNVSPRRPGVTWDELLALSGFPEPLFAGSEAKAQRWSRLRLERLVQEDLRDVSGILDISGVRVLADMLPERVGSLLSMNSLREDLQVAHGTIAAWLGVLEALYVCFLVRPYTQRVARAVAKAPKLYLYDGTGIPKMNLGARHENLTALHLRKACDYWTDTAQGVFDLHYVRNKDQREVDFLVLRNRTPWLLVECKTGDTQVAAELPGFRERLAVPRAVQLVAVPGFHRLDRASGVEVVSYERFFSGWA